MAALRTITDSERRARLGRRHHLIGRASSVAEVAGDLVGLHASDPASIYLAARARVRGIDPAAIESALYEERTLMRILAMRRTLFVIPVGLAPVLQAATSDAVAAAERRRLAGQLEDGGVAKPGRGDAWIARVTPLALASLRERGEATAVELSNDVTDLAVKLDMAPGKKYSARVSVASRMLLLLAAEGHVVRGRPRGSWISTQYRWSPAERWLGAPGASLDAADAQRELAVRWLTRFGPATETDLKWWTGWNLRQARAALAAARAEPVLLDGGVAAWVAPGDVDGSLVSDSDAGSVAGGAGESWVALLPALDPTAMGWTGRDWYLGSHRGRLFDNNGNIGPTVWCDGRIVGGWAQRPDGTVAVQLLEDIGRDRSAAIDDEAGAVEAWLGGVRFNTRFPTPLERELRA